MKTTTVKKRGNGCGIVLLTLGIVAVIAFLFKALIIDPPLKQTTGRPVSENQYIKKYAGGYTIEVIVFTGEETEAYALRDDGTASWLWIEPDGMGGAKVVQTKTGTWMATETTITTKINGKTGLLVENYDLMNGVFVHRSIDKRYLKRNK